MSLFYIIKNRAKVCEIKKEQNPLIIIINQIQTDNTATITYATTTCTLSTPRLTAHPIWAPLVHASNQTNFLPPSLLRLLPTEPE